MDFKLNRYFSIFALTLMSLLVAPSDCSYHKDTLIWVVRDGKQVQVTLEFVEIGETLVTYDFDNNKFNWEHLLIKQGTISLATEYVSQINYTTFDNKNETLALSFDQFVHLIRGDVMHYTTAREVKAGDILLMMNMSYSDNHHLDQKSSINQNKNRHFRYANVTSAKISPYKRREFYHVYTQSQNILVNGVYGACKNLHDGSEYFLIVVGFIVEHFDYKLPQIASDIARVTGLSQYIQTWIKKFENDDD
eukprot:403360780